MNDAYNHGCWVCADEVGVVGAERAGRCRDHSEQIEAECADLSSECADLKAERNAAIRRAEAAEADADRSEHLISWALTLIENADRVMGYDLMTQFGRDIAPDEACEWADGRDKWRATFQEYAKAVAERGQP